jgi:alpha-tubulin suppressor-like RCC1 family protein
VSGWGTGFGTIPADLTGVTAIAAGNGFSLALKSDGTVVGWGTTTAGYEGIPADLTGVTAITAGYDFGLALKSDGTVVGWGNNTSGQIAIPAGLTGIAKISASRFSSSQRFTLLLKSKGL